MSPKLAETLKYRSDSMEEQKEILGLDNSGGKQIDYRPSTEEITQHLVFLRSLLQRNECAVEVEDSNVHSDSQTKITEYFGKERTNGLQTIN
jgi:hypothetical protein